MQKKVWQHDITPREGGRVLARVLSEDLRQVRGTSQVPPMELHVVTAPPPGWDSSDNENLS